MTTAEQLDDALLEAYMTTYYGLGTWDAPTWFIGMEDGAPKEGQGDRFYVYVNTKLHNWQANGRPSLDTTDGGATFAPHWFGPQATLQPTWEGLIRVLLSAEGRPGNTEAVRTYQRTQLGRSDGETCLLELMPLPARSLCDWRYAEYSQRPELASRSQYRDTWAPPRVAVLRERIANYQPTRVVFYGQGYQEQWADIAGVPLQAMPLPGVTLGHGPKTVYLSIPHPTAYGMTTAYLEAAGRLLREDGA